ncbi:MAG: DUF3137 domain-containing protein [Bacteroidetes bacterium]|nr:DUF3137 domain-containing protein [Bacteroidota bacterium]
MGGERSHFNCRFEASIWPPIRNPKSLPVNPSEFRIFYNQTIHPELMRLDKQRLRMLRLILFSAVLWLVVVILVYSLSEFLFAAMVSLPFLFYLAMVGTRVQRFTAEFKPKIVKLVLDFIDDGPLYGDLKYHAKRKIPIEKFMRSKLFVTRPAVYEGEDFIEGRIGDVEFEMSELKVEEYSRVRQRLDSVFRGVFLRAKFHYPLKGAILVVPRAKLPYLSETVKAYVGGGGQNMDGFIKNAKFREAYITYGSRNTKVTDLLTEELMGFILTYGKRHDSISMSISGDNCYVALWNEKDILEPKLFQSNVSFELVREFFNDIYSAMYVVEALDRSH